MDRGDVDRQRKEHDEMMRSTRTRDTMEDKEAAVESAEESQAQRQSLAEKAGVSEQELAAKDHAQGEGQSEEETEDERHGHGGHGI